MKKMMLVLVAVFLFSGCKLELNSPEKELKSVIEGQINALNAKEVENAMKFYHPTFDAYEQTYSVLTQMLKAYTLKATLTDFVYIGEGKGFATAYVKQKTAKEDGPEFRDNEISMIVIFKKDGEVWKIWKSVNEEINFLS